MLAAIRTSDEPKQPFCLVQLCFEGSSYAVSSVKVWAGAELAACQQFPVAGALSVCLASQIS